MIVGDSTNGARSPSAGTNADSHPYCQYPVGLRLVEPREYIPNSTGVLDGRLEGEQPVSTNWGVRGMIAPKFWAKRDRKLNFEETRGSPFEPLCFINEVVLMVLTSSIGCGD